MIAPRASDARRARARRLARAACLLAAALLATPLLASPREFAARRVGQPRADFPHALLIARSRTLRGGEKALPVSELAVLARVGGAWRERVFEDPDSRVFHKALVWTPPGSAPGVLTVGGVGAALKLWRLRGVELRAEQTIWHAQFGGRLDRMRDVEAGNVLGDGASALAVATHDQGVVAVVHATGRGFAVRELDRAPNTWVHEVELGDMDGDGVPEIYATPSEPNRIGVRQAGSVVRYVPARGEGRRVVAELAGRHAKEILLDDLDGDGRDELYVSVEAIPGGRVEIRRYFADTPPAAGEVIAELPDAMCRFLVTGDLDGDGRRELVVTGRDSGVWLARPRPGSWRLDSIDRESGGFEHAALVADLDGDTRDELYVASDKHQELRRYANDRGTLTREVIWRGDPSQYALTWNLEAAPVALVASPRGEIER